jgi:gamma-glutamylcyclotransferase (GGCT)/AIG2-like uncharacterized protein YtfP
MEKLFAYGTLLEPQVHKQLYGRIVKGVPTQLRGYERRFGATDTARFWTIQAVKDGVVSGEVFELTAAELWRTDEYEGEGYDRIKVRLENGDQAWAYIAQ